MEFLKSCTTNAQAIGGFEAVAYQAVSITRDSPTAPAQPRDPSPPEDTRAVEADLRQRCFLVAHDSSRPWLWLFKSATAENAGHGIELPVLEGYVLNREQNGSIKALELARPPMRPSNPHAFPASSLGLPHKNTSGGTTRPTPSAPNSATDQPPDCLTLYELFASSVTALIAFFLVKDCGLVALNYRTFVSPAHHQHEDDRDYSDAPQSSWLTSLNVHWVSSGSLLITTTTLKDQNLRCLDDIGPETQQQLLGQCIRVAPNASLARISSFDDPLNLATDESSQTTRRKRAKITSLEQSIERWKTTVERWLNWKGFSLPHLDKRSSWVRIRHARQTPPSIPSPGAPSSDREILWPRALCYYRQDEMAHQTGPQTSNSRLHAISEEQKWFGSKGFQDPIDVAQEWFSGKMARDKTIDMRRRSKKAEEEAARRKDEPAGLYPSSPLNSRTGVYGDLQAVSGVYPTPPDGIAPGVGMSGDLSGTPATTTNIILAPGGNNPAINLFAPQDHQPAEEQEQPSTSPLFPETSENFATAGYDDDLFEDMEGDGPGTMGLNDEDFDFFDGPDDDVDMADAPALPEVTNIDHTTQPLVPMTTIPSDPIVKEEMPDPLTALENALDAAADSAEVELPPPNDPTQLAASVPDPLIESQPEASFNKIDKAVTKVPTPPLSPRAIVNALESSPKHKPTPKSQPQDLIPLGNPTFHSLDFSRRLSLADAKYQVGRFADRRESDVQPGGSSLGQEPAGIKSLRDIPLLTKLRYAVGVASASKQPSISDAGPAVSDDSDASSETSDESDDEEVEGGSREQAEDITPAVPPFLGRLIIPAKRRLPPEGNVTPLSVTSFAESFAGDWSELYGLQLEEGILMLFEPSTWDWTMINFTAPVEKSLAGARYAMPSLPPPPTQLPDTPTSQPDMSTKIPDEKTSNLKDHIVITQLITEQVTSTTLDLLNEGDDSDAHSASFMETRWQAVVKDLFPSATECGVSALAAVHDVFPDLSNQGKGQQRLPPRKQNESNALPGNHLYQISTPFIRVRRAETSWDLLPPSIAFWEPLGLAPASSPKNVVAFCIHPENESLKPLLERFLLNAQVAYDTCKLGGHTRVETEYEFGLVPWKLESEMMTPKAAFTTLSDTCVKLGQVLAAQYARIREEQDAKIDAFVIYMIDPFEEASAIWELCSAFWTLFHAYGQVAPGRTDHNRKPDLVLQIVPIRYIASSDAPVILEASTYLSLAREVYDRCPPSAPSPDKTPLNIYKAPSFHLEEGLPRGLPFKLISEPPQDLMRENSYMHLAYSFSSDGTWITAAWTDNCGKSQAVVSYHLGTRIFGEIAREIWQTTIEILQSRRVQWRVCIAKVGPMDREELEAWVLLITCPTQVNLFLTLLTVNTDSPYKLTSTGTITTQSNPQRPSTNTPGSTPQPGISPDPSMGLTPAATPSADAPEPPADPEARLVDVTDETWGAILAHRLQNSNSTNQFCPALISGLLIKRGETHATSNSIYHPIPDPMPGPITIAVNILWIGAVGSTRVATSPFPPASDGVSPGGYGANPATPGGAGTGVSPGPSPVQERSTSSLMWTPTVQTRATAENLLKEVLGQYRGLGLLAKLRGMRGTMHGVVPWHVVAAKRGVEALSKVTAGV